MNALICRAISAFAVAGALGAALLLGPTAHAQEPPPACDAEALQACYLSFTPPGAHGVLNYYTSALPVSATSTASAPTEALIALHGHPRDANKTFNAALLAVKHATGPGSGAVSEAAVGAHAPGNILVVAPLFQVSEERALKCQTKGVPAAAEGDLLWTCGSWLEGGEASGGGPTSFAALDALVAELQRQWPSLQQITIAGFSAGAQMVQHYIGFAAAPSQPVKLRYVVSDPGTWLYYDPVRPKPTLAGAAVDVSQCQGGADNLGGCVVDWAGLARQKDDNTPDSSSCPTLNTWKYGTQDLPTRFGRTAAQAREHYARADISYMEGALDSSQAAGTAFKVLDKSCAGAAQGMYRLQRGLFYAQYDRALLAPDKKRTVVIVPDCAHDVACVFPSDAARASLLGSGY